MKRILVSGYIGFNNFGDEAIFWALSNHLKSLGLDVSVLCNNKKETKKRYNVKTYNYKDIPQILKAILSNDVLISGGGSLLQNKTSNASLFYYLFIILLAKFFFKRTIIFAQGIEKIKGNFETNFTKFVLKRCDFISVRDMNSRNLLKEWGINSVLLSDPVYSILKDTKIEKEKDGLIVQLREFENITDEFLDELAFIINKFYKKGSIKILSLQDEIDKEICLKFQSKLEKLKREAIFINQKPIDETIDIINKAKYVISTRLHGLIVSSALQSKSFALIYDDKIKTLADELKLENIEIKNYKEQDLTKKLDNFFNNNQNEPHYSYRDFEWQCIDYILER